MGYTFCVIVANYVLGTVLFGCAKCCSFPYHTNFTGFPLNPVSEAPSLGHLICCHLEYGPGNIGLAGPDIRH